MKVYLDNCRSAKVEEEVVKAMIPYFTKSYGVPSSLHSLALEADEAIEKAKRSIALPINASYENIIFASGVTEANNLAIKGVAYANRNRGKHIITTRIERPSVLDSCRALEREGFKVDYLKVNNEGFININELEELIKNDTILVSIQHVNHVVGTIQAIKEIGKLIKEKNESIIFHVDATDAYLKVPIDVKKCNIDVLTIPSNLIHGPQGIAALFINENVKIKPLLHGFVSLSETRPGHENVPAIVGFGRAAEIGFAIFDDAVNKVKRLSKKLMKDIEDTFKDVVFLIGPRRRRSPFNVNYCFKYVEGEALTLQLDMMGVYVSTGSACASRELKVNYVLLELGVRPEDAHGSISFCLSRYNNEEEMDYVVRCLKRAYKNLIKISMFKDRVRI